MKPFLFPRVLSCMKRVDRVFLLCFVAMLLVPACASAPAADTADAPVISLQKEPESDAWLVTWRLAEPSRGIVFDRRMANVRPEVFEVLTRGFSFEKRDGADVLLTSGDPASEITVRIEEFSRPLPKDYELFQRFSDGSVAIYTGHFTARPIEAPDDCDECMIRSYRLAGPPQAAVVVDGQVFESPLEWTDERGQGTYVYFGTLEPVVTDDMVSIIDPGLSDWLEDEARSALPALFELYDKRFGVELPERPTILFNYLGSESSGYSSSGGTLPGLIQMEVQGSGWSERSEEAMLHLFHFIAHEAIHLWNGQIVNYPDAEDSWMHEGSAEALAERTLLELGMIGEERFLEYQTTALNECRRGLGTFPLSEAAERRAFELYYSCGNMIGLVTENAIGGNDLFDFWEALIARSLDSRVYGSEDYFAVARELGAEEEEIGSLRRFVSESATGDLLVQMLERHGVDIVTEEDPPQSYGQSVSRDALLALMSEQCKGRYGFNASPTGFELSDGLDCGPIEGGGAVTAIGGHDVLRKGHRTWDVLHERCGTDMTIPMTIRSAEGETVEIAVTCLEGKAERPPYLRIKSRL